MSDRQFYIDDETGRGHYASEPDDISASFSDELLSACPLCGSKDVYIPANNSGINCSACPCKAESDILTIEDLIIEWNKYGR